MNRKLEPQEALREIRRQNNINKTKKALENFLKASIELSTAWEELDLDKETEGFGLDPYPFTKSFEEVIEDIKSWKENFFTK